MDSGKTAGRFRLDSLLGRGGGGEVWKAWDPDLSRHVAVKLLTGSDPDDLARFRREAQTAASLAHPGIVQIYEVGPDFIAMELVGGETLAKRRPRARDAARLLRDAALALDFAHAQGIVHRDIKPSNLMVTADGRVRVMDFGLARPIRGGSSLTASGMLLGTPSYMPPEQARGDLGAIDARSDVYALGATLYDLLAGRPPFAGSDTVDIVMRVIHEEPPPVPAAPRDLVTIALLCLEKDPARRYASAREFADDLDRYLDGEPIAAKRSSRLWRMVARRRAVIGVVAGAMALAAGLGIAARVAGARRQQAIAETSEVLSARERELTAAQRALVAQMRQTSEACLEAALEIQADLAVIERRREGIAPAERLAARGIRALLSGEDAAAEAVMRECIRQAPIEEAYEGLATIASGRKDLDGAIRWCDEGLARDRGYVPYLRERARLQLDAAVADTGAGRDPEARFRAAVADFEEAVRRVPAVPGLRHELAWARTQWGRARAWRGGNGEELFAAAVDALATLLRAEPDDADALAAHGRALQAWATAGVPGPEMFERYRGAARDLERATELRPADVNAWMWLCEAHGEWASALFSRGHDADEQHRRSLDAAERLVRLRPDRAGSWLLRGRVRLNWAAARLGGGDPAGELREAAQSDFDRAAELDPASEEPAFCCAVLHYNASHLQDDPEPSYRRALAFFEEALRRAPDHPLSHRYRATVKARWGNHLADRGRDATPMFASAVEDGEVVIRQHPARADGWFLRALARQNWAAMRARRGEDASELYEAALADLEEALSRAAERATMLRMRGIVRADYANLRRSMGRDPEDLHRLALEDLDAFVRRWPQVADGWASRGAIRLSLGNDARSRGESPEADYRRGIEDLNRAITLHPGDDEHWLTRGLARMNLGSWADATRRDPMPDYEAALADLEEALKRNSRRVETWEKRASTRVNVALAVARSGGDPLRPFDEALSDVRRALALNPGSVKAVEMRALCRFNLGVRLAMREEDPTAEIRAALADFERLPAVLQARHRAEIQRCRDHLRDK